jgi:hypothetical protein
MDPSGSSSGTFSGQERVPHRPYRSLDRFGRLRCVLATLQVVCVAFRAFKAHRCVGSDPFWRQHILWRLRWGNQGESWSFHQPSTWDQMVMLQGARAKFIATTLSSPSLWRSSPKNCKRSCKPRLLISRTPSWGVFQRSA